MDEPLSLFGDVEVDAPSRRPAHAPPDPYVSVLAADRLIARGVHPASGCPVHDDRALSCAGCSRFVDATGVCTPARSTTRPVWPGCLMFVARVDPFAGGRVGVFHPRTSVAAAGRVRAGSQQARILVAAAGVGGAGFTAHDAAGWISRSTNQAGSRLGEMRAAGWLAYPDGQPERDGALIHMVTAAGLVEADRLLAATNLPQQSS